MKFTEDEILKPIEILNPTWEKIEKSLRSLNGTSKSFFILESESGDYIQCAGQPEKLALEYRIFDSGKFKHFVLAKRELKNSSQIIWTTIECKVGPIRIHENEVMNIEDAIMIFKSFYESFSVPTEITKRNVTKYFK